MVPFHRGSARFPARAGALFRAALREVDPARIAGDEVTLNASKSWGQPVPVRIRKKLWKSSNSSRSSFVDIVEGSERPSRACAMTSPP